MKEKIEKKPRRKNDALLKGAVEAEITKLFGGKISGIMAAVREQIFDEGIERGEAKGRYKEALDIALELKKEGLTIEFIAKTTKLPQKEIEALV